MYINQNSQDQHFPTPQEVARKMRSTIKQKITRTTTVLDPSAGNGVLLEVFSTCSDFRFDSKKGDRSFNLFAIEIDSELRMILNSKGFGVLGSDFLAFDEERTFDIILMNPPFSDGDSHFLKAWRLLSDGGEICCLLNRETIENPYSKERKLLLTLIEDNGGTIENLGQCFKDSDRSTLVEVAMIYVKKPTIDKPSYFSTVNFSKDSSNSEEFSSNPLAQSDAIKSLVDRYKAVERALRKRWEAQSEIDFYIEGIGYNYGMPDNVNLHNKATFESEMYAIKMRFWNYLFDKTKMTDKASSTFEAQFSDFAVKQGNMAFTYSNILELLTMVLGNQENIHKNSIDSVFKRGCDFFPDNRIHWEGWESNSAYKWGKKIIIPNFNFYGKYAGEVTTFLRDLDKVLCWITGDDYNAIGQADRLLDRNVIYGEWLSAEFVSVRFYKKGTMHLKFNDEALLAEFNRRASEGKPWMPPSRYKTKKARKESKIIEPAEINSIE